MKSRTLIVSILILLLTVTLVLARTWTAGSRTFEGKFLGLTDGGTKVRIKKADGKRVKVALEKLSKEDQDFVKKANSRSADDDLFEPDDSDTETVSSVNQYALLIGVNEYAKPMKSLEFCVNDVKLLAESFKKIGVPEENIFLMTDDSPAERRPTGTNIRQQIENVTRLMGPGDQLTITFCGHGTMVDEKSYICPSDANLDDLDSIVSRDWAFDQLEKCRAKQKIFIIDACRDEGAFGGARAIGHARTLEDPIGADAHGFILIASCDKKQKSWEDELLQHGVFTHFFAEGLAGAAQDEDGYVSVMNLFQYASAKTKKYVFREFNKVQVPTFRQGGEMTDFCVALIRRDAEAEVSGSRLRPQQGVSGSDLSPQNRSAGDRVVVTVDGIEYAFRWCPPGEFMMGSPSNEPGRYDNEGPQHKVKLTRGFWLMETEVTQEMWESVMGSNPSKFKDSRNPVENVSWDDCQDFCRELGQKLGQQVQLPTEAQWEYACRAGRTGAYAGNLDELGWYDGNSGSKTHAVGLKKPNAWGLYDMHGNVYEWCSDWFDNYAESPTSDPTGPTSGTDRVSRGGSWDSYASICRSAYRSRLNPGSRGDDLGLRLLVVPAQ